MTKFSFSLSQPFGNLYRGATVLVIVKYNKKYLLSTKKFYPPGLYRLIGGGVKPGESPLGCMFREVEEELGTCKTNIIDHAFLDEISIEAHTHKGTFTHSVFGYYIELSAQVEHISKELSEILWAELHDFRKIIQSPKEFSGQRHRLGNWFLWQDYALVYRTIQTHLLQVYMKNVSKPGIKIAPNTGCF